MDKKYAAVVKVDLHTYYYLKPIKFGVEMDLCCMSSCITPPHCSLFFEYSKPQVLFSLFIGGKYDP